MAAAVIQGFHHSCSTSCAAKDTAAVSLKQVHVCTIDHAQLTMVLAVQQHQ